MKDRSVNAEAVALEARGLTVSYGSARGIVDVDLAVPSAGVTGLLGPNGAGKSTLLRVALDLVHPTHGDIRINGISSRLPLARADVAYLPGDLLLPGHLTGWSILRRFTAGRGSMDTTRVRALAARLDLDLDRRVGQLSKGNRQKIGLVLAFAPRANLLLLDEPTSGLDPLLQREFGVLVKEATESGVATVLSSHVLSELEGLADQVAVLRAGQLVAFERTAELRARARRVVGIELSQPQDAQDLARDLDGFAVTDVKDSTVVVTYAGDVDPVIKAASRYRTISIDRRGGDLDDVLLDFYSDDFNADHFNADDFNADEPPA